MNRRKLLKGLAVGGTVAIAGCGDNNSNNGETENGEGGESNTDSLPQYVLENDIRQEFVEVHRQSLSNLTSYRIDFRDSITTQERVIKNKTESLYSERISVNESLVREKLVYFDSEELLSRYKSGSSYKYTRVGSTGPNPSEIVEESRLKTVISDANISVESSSDGEVVFTGFSDVSFTAQNGDSRDISDAAVEIVIDTQAEFIKSVKIENEGEVLFNYVVTNAGSNDFTEPNWVSDVPDTIQTVSGGFYQEGNVVILQNSGENPLQAGLNLIVIKPDGTSSSVQLEESVGETGQAYIAFGSEGNASLSVGSLPEIQNRESLQRGTYIIIGSQDGEQVFELQLSNR